jgi:hypothetical protein
MIKTIQAIFWVAAGITGRGKIGYLRILELS